MVFSTSHSQFLLLILSELCELKGNDKQEFKFDTERRTQHDPPTELFSKVENAEMLWLVKHSLHHCQFHKLSCGPSNILWFIVISIHSKYSEEFSFLILVFYQLSLKSELQPSNGCHSQIRTAQHPHVSMKVLVPFNWVNAMSSSYYDFWHLILLYWVTHFFL